MFLIRVISGEFEKCDIIMASFVLAKKKKKKKKMKIISWILNFRQVVRRGVKNNGIVFQTFAEIYWLFKYSCVIRDD